MTTRIPLNRGMFAMVDDDDAEAILEAGGWYGFTGGRSDYARRNIRLPDGRRTTQTMHVFVMGASGVDHINGNGLDNRRVNLRLATKAQNNCNRRRNLNNTSGFKGVTWHKATRKFLAQINVEGHRTHLGLFTDPVEAAKAYDAAAHAAFGRFAHPNFVNEETR